MNHRAPSAQGPPGREPGPAFAGLSQAAQRGATRGPAGAGASATASCQGRGDSRAPAAAVLCLAAVGS
eukprot:6821491-Pyramimonas_sp.AAC.1